MNARPSLQLIEPGEIPDYPIPAGERLESHSFFLFHFDRWLNSDLYLLGDWDVKGIAHALWCLAQSQDPVGTLPDNPRLIAALLRMSTDQWDGYLRRAPSPLHGWARCRVGDEIRLYHKTVTEVALAALGEKTKNIDRQGADAERKKMARLRDMVSKLAGARLSGNEMFMAQLFLILERQFPGGSFTTARVVNVMQHDLGVRDLQY